jgi:Fe-Mn family superoxide dismutase
LRGELLMAVERDFGSVLEFREQFAKAGVSQFGSGWVWLVLRDEGKLAIKATANAENPLTSGETPLLTCDVWEHAYYLDYRNERPRYVESVFKVLDWEFAERNFRSRAGLAA